MKRILLNNAFPSFPCELINDLSRYGILRSFGCDDLVILEGEQFQNVFIILDGSVQLLRTSNEGVEFSLTFLEGPSSVGVTISDDTPDINKVSHITIRAVELTYVLFLPFYYKDQIAKKHDQWYKFILHSAVQFYWIYLDVIDNIAFKKLDFRLENYILKYAAFKKTNLLHISHKKVADNLNASRETVSRLLKKMEEMGKIRLGHNVIEILK